MVRRPDWLADNGRAIDDALKTVAAVEAAYRSSERGGEPSDRPRWPKIVSRLSQASPNGSRRCDTGRQNQEKPGAPPSNLIANYK